MMGILDDLATQRKIIDLINKILNAHDIGAAVEFEDITINDRSVIDASRKMPKLSGAIIDAWIPSIKSARVHHFTTRVAAEKILGSGEFRLSCILGRINEHEILSFCEAHNLTGYLEKDEFGVPTYSKIIAPNTFYASFAGSDLTEEQENCLWRRFASIDGVRITFDIQAANPDFRKVVYESKRQPNIPVLIELRESIRKKFGKELHFIGASRLCSFFLPEKDYGVENEYRMLYRVWDGGIRQPSQENGKQYISLPLNAMSDIGFRLDVLDVQSSSRPNMSSHYPFTLRSAGA